MITEFIASRAAGSCAIVALLACGRAEKRVTDSSAAVTESAASSTTRVTQNASRCGDRLIRDAGVGAIGIGDPADSLRKCHLVRDTMVAIDEGGTARMIFIALGSDTVVAEIVGDRVWRIQVLSPGLKTADSIGVGARIGRLLQLRNSRGAMGEERLFVVSPEHCGMSFQLKPVDPRLHPREWNQSALAALPDSTRVSRILIFGCDVARRIPD